jgi:hypothetical protein
MPLVVSTDAGDTFVDATDADGSTVIVKQPVSHDEVAWTFVREGKN